MSNPHNEKGKDNAISPASFMRASAVRMVEAVSGCLPLKEQVEFDLGQFAKVEAFSHSLKGAYGAFERVDGDTVTIKGQTFEVRKINTDTDALIGEIFMPVDPSCTDVWINWTGTSNGPMLTADFEKTPGENSYRRNELSILRQINQAIDEVNAKAEGKLSIMVSGHSLGGALSQLTFDTIQRAIAQNGYHGQPHKTDHANWKMAHRRFKEDMGAWLAPSKALFDKQDIHALDCSNIRQLIIGNWNAPGVFEAIEASSNALAPLIRRLGIRLKAYYGQVVGDDIQHTGHGHVLSDVSPKDADVNLMCVHMDGVDSWFYGYENQVILGTLSMSGVMMALGPGFLAFELGLLTALKILDVTIKHTGVHFKSVDPALDDIEFSDGHAKGTQTISFKGKEHAVHYDLYKNNTEESRNQIKSLLRKYWVIQENWGQAIRQGIHFTFNTLFGDGKHQDQPESKPPVNQTLRRFAAS